MRSLLTFSAVGATLCVLAMAVPAGAAVRKVDGLQNGAAVSTDLSARRYYHRRYVHRYYGYYGRHYYGYYRPRYYGYYGRRYYGPRYGYGYYGGYYRPYYYPYAYYGPSYGYGSYYYRRPGIYFGFGF